MGVTATGCGVSFGRDEHALASGSEMVPQPASVPRPLSCALKEGDFFGMWIVSQVRNKDALSSPRAPSGNPTHRGGLPTQSSCPLPPAVVRPVFPAARVGEGPCILTGAEDPAALLSDLGFEPQHRALRVEIPQAPIQIVPLEPCKQPAPWLPSRLGDTHQGCQVS